MVQTSLERIGTIARRAHNLILDDVNVWNFLADAARRWPDRPTLTQGHRQISYVEARDRALKLAANLRDRGVREGDRVGCLMHNDIDHLIAYFGVAAAGAILVSLNTRLTDNEQRDILAHSGARWLVHDDAHELRAGILERELLRVPQHGAPGAQTFLLEDDEPAQLYYTSGTTGAPKGVTLTHRNVCTHADAAIRELHLTERDTWSHIAPMFHLADAWATFAITAVGGRHTFLPSFTARAALALLVDEHVTITNLVPTMLNLMVKEADAGERSYQLRSMLSGGAPIAPDVVRRIIDTFKCDYVQTYGMTETSPYLTMSLLPPEMAQLPMEQQLHYKCKTGRPFHGVELKVVDEHGAPIANDAAEVGEIRVRGETVTPGYWHDDEATAAAFDADGFLMTGDLATIDARGFVDIVDRKKDVIKTGAETVYSVEVEHVLYEHPAVLECAVFGKPDEKWGERVVAAIVLRTDHSTSAAELIAWCRQRIAGYKTPKEVVFHAELPRTGSGKIQKRALRDV